MYNTSIEANTDEWLEERKKYLSASDIAAVIGVNKWKTWDEVKYGKQEFTPEQLKKFAAGHAIEKSLKELWEQEVPGRKVDERKSTLWTDGYLAATPDGFGYDPDFDTSGLIEAKSVSYRLMGHWDEGPPLYVILQVQGQLMCTGAPHCDVVAAIGGPGYEEWRIYPHEGLQVLIREAAEAYMTGEPDNQLQVAWLMRLHDMGFDIPNDKKFPVGDPEKVVESPQNITSALISARAARDAAQKDYEEALELAQNHMGTAEYLTVGDQVLATWKTSNRKRLDKKLLAELISPEAMEAVYTDYTVRTFLVKDVGPSADTATIW